MHEPTLVFRILEGVVRATLLAVAALFPIVNPLGSAVLFLSLTRGYSRELRGALVWAITVNSFVLLLVSMLIGSHVLAFFGISIPVVLVGGGLVVFALGWSMLQQKAESSAAPAMLGPDVARQQAFYPLTLPVTVGPGSLAVAVAVGANSHLIRYPIVRLSASLLGPLIIAITIFICYYYADRLERLLGETGLTVFTRLMSFIVLCIGIQILWNGVSSLIHPQ